MRAPARLRRLSERLPKKGSPARFWMHVPAGLLTALAITVSPLVAIMLFVGFLAYEVVEDWRLGDFGYIDIEGYVGGLWVGAGILVVLFTLKWLEVPLGPFLR